MKYLDNLNVRCAAESKRRFLMACAKVNLKIKPAPPASPSDRVRSFMDSFADSVLGKSK